MQETLECCNDAGAFGPAQNVFVPGDDIAQVSVIGMGKLRRVICKLNRSVY